MAGPVLQPKTVTMIPCFVITRDRVTYLKTCLASLMTCPELDIHIVDHGSTWPPMVEYLDWPPVLVHRRPAHPPRDLWTWDGLPDVVEDQPYLVTDPDVVLDCPTDWLTQLQIELADHPEAAKVGLGLRIDDLPDTALAAKVIDWERGFWGASASLANRRGFRAPVDTTLALYSPLTTRPGFMVGPAVRLNSPYLLRHLPWYEVDESEELAYYRAHALPGTSHWAHGGWPT